MANNPAFAPVTTSATALPLLVVSQLPTNALSVVVEPLLPSPLPASEGDGESVEADESVPPLADPPSDPPSPLHPASSSTAATPAAEATPALRASTRAYVTEVTGKLPTSSR
ncbi:hypothetical protein GCM10023084_52690 [Streptomyces lacrimifluminis]|uniref:Uncharacterized protein n=1 Tax=Streptomyces lacrimifluminis TaxID=1500077 RepID=A0A917LAH9_9ACTN|nr:hypothetical protein GCM10012282_59810 [Streptomyces lacrimifluminis]